MNIITDQACMGYWQPGHPERPERIARTQVRLREQNGLPVTWIDSAAAEDSAILRAHSAAHLARLDEPEDFDLDTAYFEGISGYARQSAGAALQALAFARKGEPAFSLMRPPGHHAIRNQAMGFCYLNNIAIAVLEALATGAKRVAVYDFDVHHGNGTEAILVNHEGVAFFSIHQSPCYPGTGTRNVGHNCFNFPVFPRTPREEYCKVLSRALADLAKFKPDLVAVSAGFDAYVHEPIAQETLEVEDFHWIGQEIRKLGLPVFSVLEGGYSYDLPELILAYLQGLEGH
jgi:acetoin utilization deacetylase AcuC-like enzyme